MKRHGYVYLSLSDILREAAALSGRPPSRETLIELGRSLREQAGPGALAQKTIEKLGEGSYVIDSIRSPAEVALLKACGTFVLLSVDAAPAVRFERAKLRGRLENAPTLEKFLELEQRENSESPLAQQVDQTLKLADHVIQNDGTLKDLEARVSEILIRHGFPWPVTC
jgi:dephospho-CoA kinase